MTQPTNSQINDALNRGPYLQLIRDKRGIDALSAKDKKVLGLYKQLIAFQE